MKFQCRRVDWPLAAILRIARGEQTRVETIQLELCDGPLTGRGEAIGVPYHGETVDSLLTQLSAAVEHVTNGISRAELQNLLPPGGARNALDCALWDLEAKRAGSRAWEVAGITPVHSLLTAYTLSLDSPAVMARAAAYVDQYPILKLKLCGEGDVERVSAVRAARPDATLIVDANQAWNRRQLYEFMPRLADLGVKLVEQPLPATQDDLLVTFNTPIPLCADESCQATDSLPSLIGKYQYVNIKLDKTGGLTEALRLARAAQAAGFRLMVGCMAGSSLSMAPAFVVGQLCDVVDLDGPLLAASDVPDAIVYQGNRMHAPEVALWG